jgi:predicted RNA-binding Zn ribbon-like protein
MKQSSSPAAATPPHLFLGGHPAIDFLNTAYAPDGRVTETIGDGRAFMHWMVRGGLLEEALAARLTRRFGAQAIDAAASEARKMREWAREWIGRWRTDPHADYRQEIDALNRMLARAPRYSEVVVGVEGIRVLERDQLESADALLALLARDIAALISQEEPSLVKACAGSSCTLWFLDRTRGHRRMFCSASACGNRAKVAAFRARQRDS